MDRPFVIRSVMGNRDWYWSKNARGNGSSMWSRDWALLHTFDNPEQAREAIYSIGNPCRCEIVQVDQDEMDCIQEARARSDGRKYRAWRKYQMVEVEE